MLPFDKVSRYVLMQGDMRAWESRAHEIGVFVSVQRCSIITIYSNKIHCKPPNETSIKNVENPTCTEGYPVVVSFQA